MFHTLFHPPSHSSTSFAFGNHTQFPKFSDRAFSKVPHPLLAKWMEHKTQAWPFGVSCLQASDWLGDGHVTEAGAISLPWEFYSAKDQETICFFWTCWAWRVGVGAAGELLGLFAFPQLTSPLGCPIVVSCSAYPHLSLAAPLQTYPLSPFGLRTQRDESI